jgi:hypothetical protein
MKRRLPTVAVTSEPSTRRAMSFATGTSPVVATGLSDMNEDPARQAIVSFPSLESKGEVLPGVLEHFATGPSRLRWTLLCPGRRLGSAGLV